MPKGWERIFVTQAQEYLNESFKNTIINSQWIRALSLGKIVINDAFYKCFSLLKTSAGECV